MKKEIASLVMSLALVSSVVLISPMNVSAAGNTETSTEGTISATVKTATGGSGSDSSVFVVAIPQEITLNRTAYKTFSGAYETAVKAVLAPGKKVKVAPASTFRMTKTDDSSKEYTATVNQEKIVWVDETSTPDANELKALPDTYTASEGSITVDIPTVGSYTGQLGFVVSLE